MSEVIWQMLICFAAGMGVTALMSLIRDLLDSRRIKRKMKRAMVEYAEARATLNTNEGNQS